MHSIVVMILFSISVFLFDIRVKGSVVTALTFLMLHSLAGCCHGLFATAIAHGFFMASVLSTGILLFFFIISGETELGRS